MPIDHSVSGVQNKTQLSEIDTVSGVSRATLIQRTKVLAGKGHLTKDDFNELSSHVEGGKNALSRILETVSTKDDVAKLQRFIFSQPLQLEGNKKDLLLNAIETALTKQITTQDDDDFLLVSEEDEHAVSFKEEVISQNHNSNNVTANTDTITHVIDWSDLESMYSNGREALDSGINTESLEKAEENLELAKKALKEMNTFKTNLTSDIESIRQKDLVTIDRKIGEIQALFIHLEEHIQVIKDFNSEVTTGLEKANTGLKGGILQVEEAFLHVAQKALKSSEESFIKLGNIEKPSATAKITALRLRAGELEASVKSLKAVEQIKTDAHMVKVSVQNGMITDNQDKAESELQNAKQLLEKAMDSLGSGLILDKHKELAINEIKPLEGQISKLEAHVEVIKELNNAINEGISKIDSAFLSLNTKEISGLNSAEALLHESEKALEIAQASFEKLGNIDKTESQNKIENLKAKISGLKTEIFNTALEVGNLKVEEGMSAENKSIYKITELNALFSDSGEALAIAERNKPENNDEKDIESLKVKITELSDRIAILTKIDNAKNLDSFVQFVETSPAKIINDYIDNIFEKIDVFNPQFESLRNEEITVIDIINQVLSPISDMEKINTDTLFKVYGKVNELIENVPKEYLENPVSEDESKSFLLNSVNSIKNNITEKLYELGIDDFKSDLLKVSSKEEYTQFIAKLDNDLADIDRQIAAFGQGQIPPEIVGTPMENIDPEILKDSLIRYKNILLKEVIMSPLADFQTAYSFAAYTGDHSNNFDGRGFDYSTAINRKNEIFPCALTESEDEAVKIRIRELYKQEPVKDMQLKEEITQTLFGALENLKEGKFTRADFQVIVNNIDDKSKLENLLKSIDSSITDRDIQRFYSTWNASHQHEDFHIFSADKVNFSNIRVDTQKIKTLSEALEKQLREQIPSRMKETPVFLQTVAPTDGLLNSVENIMHVTVNAGAQFRPPLNNLLLGATAGVTASVHGKAQVNPDGTVEVTYKVSYKASANVTLPDYNLPKLEDFLKKLNLELPKIGLPEINIPKTVSFRTGNSVTTNSGAGNSGTINSETDMSELNISELPKFWLDLQAKFPHLNIPDFDVTWPKLTEIPELNIPKINMPGFPEIPGLPNIGLSGLGSREVSVSTEKEVMKVKDQTFKFKSVEEFNLYQKTGGSGFTQVDERTNLINARSKSYSWDGAKEFRPVSSEISKSITKLTGKHLEEQTTEHSYAAKLLRSVFSTSVHVMTSRETTDAGNARKSTKTKVTTFDTRAESLFFTKNTTSTMAAIKTDLAGNFQEGMVAIDFNIEKIKDNISKEAFIQKQTRRLVQVLTEQNKDKSVTINESKIVAQLRANIDKLLAEIEEEKGVELGNDLTSAKAKLGEQGLGKGLKELDGAMFNEVGFSATYNNIHAEVSFKNIKMVRFYMLLEESPDKREINPSVENSVIQISSQQGASFGVGFDVDLAIASVKAMINVSVEHNRADTVETASHKGSLNHVYHSEVYHKAKLTQLETEVTTQGNIVSDLLALKKLAVLTKDMAETDIELAGNNPEPEHQQTKAHLLNALQDNKAKAVAIFNQLEGRIGNQIQLISNLLSPELITKFDELKSRITSVNEQINDISDKINELMKFTEKFNSFG